MRLKDKTAIMTRGSGGELVKQLLKDFYVKAVK